MSSLHTKWRPEKFEDVLGQDTIVRSLKKVVKDARAHAFIFTGPSGTGKTTLARILANEFSGADRSIVNLEEIDGASKSGKDDARELVNRSLYRAIGSSPVRFIIVDEAHLLSSSAWAVLLKPIEEPASHVYWAFCTTDAGKIPKAIGTRCLKYDLKPVKEELLLELLIKVVDTEGFDISDEIVEAIAEASLGSPRQALVHLEACLSAKSLDDARSLIRTAGQSKEIIDIARWLLAGKGLNWSSAAKLIRSLGAAEAESCRIVLMNYFTAVLLNTTSDAKAKPILYLMDCFARPYNTSDKMAPFLLSIGEALGLNR